MAYGFCDWKYLWDFFGVYKRFTETSKWFYRTSGAGKQSGQWIYSYGTRKLTIALVVRAGGLMLDTLWTGSAKSAPAMKSAT